jgi:hypothetical protein
MREHLVGPRSTVMKPIVAIQLSEPMTAALACWGFCRRHIPPFHEVFRLAFDAPDGAHLVILDFPECREPDQATEER